MLKRERDSWDDPSTRRTRTKKRCSSDARSWDHPSHPLGSDKSPSAWLGSRRVSARQGWAGENAKHFEHPVGFSVAVCHDGFPETG